MNGPFILPVRDIVHRSGEMREFVIDTPAPEKWGEGLVAVAAGEPIELSVRVESVHEGILVTADIATRYEGVCGRCLTDIAQPLEVEFQELFGYPGTEATDFEVHDDHVDLEPAVRDTIVLALPFQPVCQADCPGLDPVTGEKLIVEEGYDPTDAADPRWAELQNFTRGGEAKSPAAEHPFENTEKS